MAPLAPEALTPLISILLTHKFYRVYLGICVMYCQSFINIGKFFDILPNNYSYASQQMQNFRISINYYNCSPHQCRLSKLCFINAPQKVLQHAATWRELTFDIPYR